VKRVFGLIALLVAAALILPPLPPRLRLLFPLLLLPPRLRVAAICRCSVGSLGGLRLPKVARDVAARDAPLAGQARAAGASSAPPNGGRGEDLFQSADADTRYKNDKADWEHS
jgi:hypothetical protein